MIRFIEGFWKLTLFLKFQFKKRIDNVLTYYKFLKVQEGTRKSVFLSCALATQLPSGGNQNYHFMYFQEIL